MDKLTLDAVEKAVADMVWHCVEPVRHLGQNWFVLLGPTLKEPPHRSWMVGDDARALLKNTVFEGFEGNLYAIPDTWRKDA